MQDVLAETIYEDKNHSPNICVALTGLMSDGKIIHSGNYPSYYSLSSIEVNVSSTENQRIESALLRILRAGFLGIKEYATRAERRLTKKLSTER